MSEEANFTRAADRVHISQSGISAQIRQLERDLGATLFDRSGRTARLTAAGAAALGPARAVLASAASVRQAVDEVNGLIRGRLVVGMVTACTVTGLFDALASFHLEHPGVAITLVEDASDRLVDRVLSGQADLALIGASGGPPPGLEALTIISEGLAAAVPPGHPLAGRDRVGLAELAAYPIVCLPRGTGVRAVLDQACAARGLQPEIALEASAPSTVTDLAARGLGVAVLSATMAAVQSQQQPGRLAALTIEDVAIASVLALVWPQAQSPALREFLRHSRRAFASPPAGELVPSHVTALRL